MTGTETRRQSPGKCRDHACSRHEPATRTRPGRPGQLPTPAAPEPHVLARQKSCVYCDPQAQSPSWPVPSPATPSVGQSQLTALWSGWAKQKTLVTEQGSPHTPSYPGTISTLVRDEPGQSSHVPLLSSAEPSGQRNTVTPNVITTEMSHTEMSHRDLLYRPIPELQMTFIYINFQTIQHKKFLAI